TLSVSRGLANWLSSEKVSLAFTSHESGQLFLAGWSAGGIVSVQQQNFPRAMGLAASSDRIFLGGLQQVWRLENVLADGQVANERFDRLFVPRAAYTTGDIDIHELSVGGDGRVVFVNTKYSCLATLDERHSFVPLWQPPFVS